MFLHLPSPPPIHPPTHPSSKSLSLLFRTFEDSLTALLRSLLAPGPGAGGPPAASCSYLSRAVSVLASVHALADALISDPALSGSDEAAAASYLASSIKLLDVCNAISAEVERLHRGRLLLLFAAHLTSSGAPPTPDKISKAKEAIAEWEGSAPGGDVPEAAAELIRDLARRGAPPRGRATALGRAVYAVEAVSGLIAGALVASLGGEVDLSAGIKGPAEYAWGEAFNQLRAALSGEICGRRPTEARDVEAAARGLAEILNGPAEEGEEKRADRLRSAVGELQRAAEGMTGGLDRLGGAVNALFRAVLGARNTALHSFRLRPNKCK